MTLNHALTVVVALVAVLSACATGEISADAQSESVAVRWVPVDTTGEVSFALDSRSLARADSGRVSVWVRASHSSAQPGISVTSMRSYASSLIQMEVDCDRRRTRYLRRVYRDSLDVDIGEFAGPTEWSSVVPESNDEVMADSTCSLSARWLGPHPRS